MFVLRAVHKAKFFVWYKVSDTLGHWSLFISEAVRFTDLASLPTTKLSIEQIGRVIGPDRWEDDQWVFDLQVVGARQQLINFSPT